ncbi:MAG: hypothetical protein WA172_16135 [Terriglobales bacterium]
MERVVGEVLDNHVAVLRGEIVRRVMEEIAVQPADSVAPSATSASDLARGISEIQAGASQKEILRALLDSSSHFAARVALFVVKSGHAAGWQARGFQSSDALKDFALDSSAPAVVRALAGRPAASVPATEFDARFLERFGSPVSGESRLLPLILKDKVAALVYADAGTDGTLLDVDSLGVLVLATGAWLEVNALRKQAHKEPSAGAGDGHSQTAPAPPAGGFNDPFAAHAPVYAMAAAASGDSQSTVVVSPPESLLGNLEQTPVAEAQSAAVELQSSVAASLPPALGLYSIPWVETGMQTGVQTDIPNGVAPEASSQASTIPAEDEEVHYKARRFARLLVEEIKLYNQDKVLEGRKNNDLCERLKDAIDKSRSTYQKRYGKTVAASANYFEDEVKRSLAEDDRQGTNSNFRM